MSGYKGGRILRIKVKDFMTYDELEIFPKKGLNIIIGLNGSGKSSVMSAICLGLAGKPQFTGKSSVIADFIKHGKQRATIEIELEDPPQNPVICRVIEGDKSTWFLNNSSVHQNEILSTIRRYNIDVGNLCQFLPQEKVSDFSKIDHKQRLETLIQAVGEPILHTQFNELKQMREDVCNLENELNKLTNRQNSYLQTNERLKVEVDKHEARMKLEEELETFKLRRKFLEYEGYQHNSAELKKEKVKLKRQIAKLKKELSEKESDFNAVSSTCNGKLCSIKEAGTKSIEISEQLSVCQNKLVEMHEEVESAKIEYQNRINEKRNQKEKLDDLEKQIRAFKYLRNGNAEQEKELKARSTENRAKYETVREEMNKVDLEMENVKLQIYSHERRKKGFSIQMSVLMNQQKYQTEQLKVRFPDTYQALCWIDENKSTLKSIVCLPALLSMSVLRDEDRKYIENLVSLRDLNTFVCTDKEDVEHLIKILHLEKGLKINIAPAPTSSFTLPDVPPRLRQMGVERFVSELFTAPEPVMLFLCNLYKLHTVPVCSADAENHANQLLQCFPRFFTPFRKFLRRSSKYGSRNVTIMNVPIQDKHFIQSAAVASISKETKELEAKIKEAQEQIDCLTSQVKTLEKQRSVFERQQEQLRNEKCELGGSLSKLSTVEANLRQKVESYKKKMSELIHEDEEKRKLTSKISIINNQRMEALTQIKTLGLEFVKLKVQNVKDVLYAKSLSKEISKLRTVVEEKKGSCAIVEQALAEKIRESEEINRKAYPLLEFLKSRGSSIVEELRSHLPNLEEIESEIIKIQAQLDLNYEVNESILQDYRNRQKTIMEIGEKIEDFENKLRLLKMDIGKIKQQWLPALQSHIEIINRKFSHYFKLLKCAGEITLETGDDPDDFAQYGLQVRLKYRDNEAFCVLSPDHHSGGERNVASVIFILSLQELATVPFRCVDEINQGMDPSNERKMYEFIAADAAKTSSCSQYFLLTPKLLKNLPYHKDVAVHVIFNSRFLNTKLNIKEDLRMRKRLN